MCGPVIRTMVCYNEVINNGLGCNRGINRTLMFEEKRGHETIWPSMCGRVICYTFMIERNMYANGAAAIQVEVVRQNRPQKRATFGMGPLNIAFKLFKPTQLC